METIVIEEEGDDRRHIHNAPLRSGGAAITLCGWVDVAHHYEEGAPSCEDCLEIVRYCQQLELTVRPRRPDTRSSGTGTKRPYRLLFTDNGVLTNALYSSYSTAERAWAGLDRLLDERKARRWPTERDGWWVVSGPGYQEVRGVGREADKPLPFIHMRTW